MITGCCACFASRAAFKSNRFMRSLVKPEVVFQPSVMCYPSEWLFFSEVQVENCWPACIDDNRHTNVSIFFRSRIDRIGPNGQRYDFGNFIAARNVIFDVPKELSVKRVDGVGTMCVVCHTAVVEFIRGRIDHERAGAIVQMPWPY